VHSESLTPSTNAENPREFGASFLTLPGRKQLSGTVTFHWYYACSSLSGLDVFAGFSIDLHDSRTFKHHYARLAQPI